MLTVGQNAADIDTIVDRVATRVAAGFPNLPEDEVVDLVRAEATDLAHAPVQNYVEILVETRVRGRLRNRA